MRGFWRFCINIALVFVLCAITVEANAVEVGGITILGEIALPDDLNFSVSDTCHKHTSFMQADAREDGCFIVYSRYTDTEKYSGQTFKKVYIDIYNSDGRFFQEISFTTPLDIAVELTDTTINIYFYNFIIVYDLQTQALHNYSIPNGTAVNGGVYETLRAESFVCGDWRYQYQKSFYGYTKLTRYKGDSEQVLIEMPGIGNGYMLIGVPILSAIGAIIIIIRIKKRKE